MFSLTVVFEVDAVDAAVLVEKVDESEEEDGNEEQADEQHPAQLQQQHHDDALKGTNLPASESA